MSVLVLILFLVEILLMILLSKLFKDILRGGGEGCLQLLYRSAMQLFAQEFV